MPPAVKTAPIATTLRPNWYSSLTPEADLAASGIYEWRIAGVGLYIGKAKILHKRINAYSINLRRMIDGLLGTAIRKKYRLIHEELRKAYDHNLPVSVAVLETCDSTVRAERERVWIQRRREEELAGGPRTLNEI